MVPQILLSLALLELAVSLHGIFCSRSFNEQICCFVKMTDFNIRSYKDQFQYNYKQNTKFKHRGCINTFSLLCEVNETK